MYQKYNDFELLYLIDEGSELAYEALVTKYYYLINKKIKDFHIKDKYHEDYIQEGLIVLEQAIRSYNEYRGKSFNMFFLMLLSFRFQRLLAIEKNYFYNVTLIEFPEMISENEGTYDGKTIEDYIDCNLSELELEIITLIYNGYKPRDIARVKKMNARQIYNGIARIKVKMGKNK